MMILTSLRENKHLNAPQRTAQKTLAYSAKSEKESAIMYKQRYIQLRSTYLQCLILVPRRSVFSHNQFALKCCRVIGL